MGSSWLFAEFKLLLILLISETKKATRTNGFCSSWVPPDQAIREQGYGHVTRGMDYKKEDWLTPQDLKQTCSENKTSFSYRLKICQQQHKLYLHDGNVVIVLQKL